MPRNILKVIDSIKSTCEYKVSIEALEQLQHIRYSATYTAPEAMYVRWKQLVIWASIIIPYPTEDWHFEVLSILTDKSVFELKQGV